MNQPTETEEWRTHWQKQPTPRHATSPEGYCGKCGAMWPCVHVRERRTSAQQREGRSR